MNKEQALELCKVYEVNPSEHPAIVVTHAGNIYPNGNVDPADTSGIVDLSEEKEKSEDEPGKRKKKS